MPLVNDTSNVKTQTNVDQFGNSITTGVSNDKLTNEDFLTLMLTELQYQDPTKPMDSQQMMDSQLKMSSIETNSEMAESMKSLEKTFTQSSMSTAINYMGKKLDAVVNVPQKDSNGNVLKDSNGDVLFEKIRSPFKIETVESVDGEIKLNAKEFLGLEDKGVNLENKNEFSYNKVTGQISEASGGKKVNDDGSITQYFVKLSDEGRFERDSNGDLRIVDQNGNTVKPTFVPDETKPDVSIPVFAFNETLEVYATNTTSLKYEDVVKIYPF